MSDNGKLLNEQQPSKRSAPSFKRAGTGRGRGRARAHSAAAAAIRAPLAAALNETTVDLSTCICCAALSLQSPVPPVTVLYVRAQRSCLTPVAGYSVSGKLRLSAK